MESIKLYGLRLAAARRMRGVSTRELAEMINGAVSAQMISKYEQGASMPNSMVFMSIAKALRLPFDYFVRPFSVKITNVEYHEKKGVSAKELTKAEEAIKDKLERCLEIESLLAEEKHGNAPKFDVSCETDAKAAANKLRDEWGLGRGGWLNIIGSLEENGIMVVEIEADSTFGGQCGMADGRPFVAVSRSLTAERKRFDILHELGHIVLRFVNDHHRDVESLCDAFANEMLISDETLRKEIGEKRKDISLEELRGIQRSYGISPESLMEKALSARIISENRYRIFRSKMTQPGFATLVNESLFPNESSNRFERMVYRSLACDIITTSRAAALLHSSVEAVSRQLELV